ncbi:MAG: penicillin acylase family protein [Pseudomonadota bacterium]|nr:penicillin acylase family protein [Pseudomonadota bacterium]
MNRLLKISVRTLLWLLGLVMLALLIGWLALRGSLAKLDGETALPGLEQPVRVSRDALGMVDIEASNRHDAMRALGFVHAQERYFEMDLMRRAAAGELSALFGPKAVETDKARRVHRLRARIEADFDQVTQGQNELIRAYTEGVNAGLAALRVRPWPYLLLRQQPQPWRDSDTALVGYAMYFDLQDSANRRELAMLQLSKILPASAYALLAHPGSEWDAPISGEATGNAALPSADQLDLRRQRAPGYPIIPLKPNLVPGSNNFAVAASASRDGRAILANDMHLGLRAPALWFRARLRYADATAPGGKVDVAGVTLPGLPAVVVGSNGHVAWGFTNSYGDWLDWARVPACNRASCRHEETIEVANGSPVTLVVEESDWGPILDKDSDNQPLALRWVAHLPGSLNIVLGDFAGAGSIEEALAIADNAALPAQNLLLADRTGRIGWRLLGPIPQRGNACQPQAISAITDCPPWPTSTAGNPRVLDPADGRLWTANTRVVDGEDLARIGDGGYDLGARGKQIRDGLRAKPVLDERDLLAIQLDDRALFLERWWALLQREAKHGGPAIKQLAEAAATWEGHAAPDTVSYRLVRSWRLAVHSRLADGLLAAAEQIPGDYQLPKLPQFEGSAWPMVSAQPIHLLSPRYPDWPTLFDDAAQHVIDEGMQHHPHRAPELAQRRWGGRNIAHICHPLVAASELLQRWLCMASDELPGDIDMPRVQSPAFGASQRIVVAPGHEADGILQLPGGQSGHPLSPFWGAGHADWVSGRPTPLLPGNTVNQLVLKCGGLINVDTRQDQFLTSR